MSKSETWTGPANVALKRPSNRAGSLTQVGHPITHLWAVEKNTQQLASLYWNIQKKHKKLGSIIMYNPLSSSNRVWTWLNRWICLAGSLHSMDRSMWDQASRGCYMWCQWRLSLDLRWCQGRQSTDGSPTSGHQQREEMEKMMENDDEIRFYHHGDVSWRPIFWSNSEYESWSREYCWKLCSGLHQQ